MKALELLGELGASGDMVTQLIERYERDGVDSLGDRRSSHP